MTLQVANWFQCLTTLNANLFRLLRVLPVWWSSLSLGLLINLESYESFLSLPFFERRYFEGFESQLFRFFRSSGCLFWGTNSLLVVSSIIKLLMEVSYPRTWSSFSSAPWASPSLERITILQFIFNPKEDLFEHASISRSSLSFYVFQT